MKNKLPLLLFVLFILGAITVIHYKKNYVSVSPSTKGVFPSPTISVKSAKIYFGNVIVNAEIVDNMVSKEKGLSYRESLADNSGMLFVFDNYQIPIFWMKGMNFPLDIIWLKDDVVVDIDKNVPVPDKETADDYLPKYSPKEKVNYVLEVNAGYVDKNKIKVGDRVNMQL